MLWESIHMITWSRFTDFIFDYNTQNLNEMSEDTKRVVRSRKLKKDGMVKRKRIKCYTKNLKIEQHEPHIKTGDELMCLWGVSSSYKLVYINNGCEL
jgi:hypothetical protein